MENAPNETDKKALTIIIKKFNINQRVNTMNLAINVYFHISPLLI